MRALITVLIGFLANLTGLVALEYSTAQIPPEVTCFFHSLHAKQIQVESTKHTSTYSAGHPGLSVVADAYGGLHVDISATKDLSPDDVRAAITHLAESARASGTFDSLWIDVKMPVDARQLTSFSPSDFVIGVPGQGDLVYDYQKQCLSIWQWINSEKECTIPAGATHNLGATAVLYDLPAKKILLVVNAGRNDSWNLPGGGYEPLKDKTVWEAALREAQEESGLNLHGSAISSPKLVGQMQFPNNQFAPAINQVWAFAVPGCSEQPLTPQPGEVLQAEWIDFDEVLNSNGRLRGYELGAEFRSLLLGAIADRGFSEIINTGYKIVHAPADNREAKGFSQVKSIEELYDVLETPLASDEWGILALDLDHTLIQSKTVLGDENFYRFLQHQNKAHGRDEDAHYAWSTLIRSTLVYETCERVDRVNDVITTFRDKGWTVRVLTSRGIDMRETTGMHLQQAGLDLTLDDVIFKEADKYGQLMPKNQCLAQWMKEQPEWNRRVNARVVFLDDAVKYCKEVENLTDEVAQAQVTCLQYVGALPSERLSKRQKEMLAIQLVAWQNKQALSTTYNDELLQTTLRMFEVTEITKETLYKAMRDIATRDGFAF